MYYLESLLYLGAERGKFWIKVCLKLDFLCRDKPGPRVKILEILCLKLEFLCRTEPVTKVPEHEALDRRERVIVHKH